VLLLLLITTTVRSLSSPTPIKLLHSSALALVPPNECWNEIQKLRVDNRDAGLFRWPPHMNLIYPFVLPQRYQDVGRTLLPFESFDVTFNGELGVFGGR